MEAKKNPSKDIHRKSGMFFQIGLIISITIVIAAFEWRTEVKKVKPRVVDGYEPIVLISVTQHEPKEPPTPSPIKNEVRENKSFTPIATETTSETTTEAPEPVVDPETFPSTPILIEQDPLEICEECIFTFAETAPKPVGGLEGFYSIVKKNIKYPKRAQNMGVEGKVTVEFVINRDGTPVDFRIISGIGAGCDEEAMRVIGLTQWNPGKQRGRPVRVRMVMPITFRLH